MNNKTLIKALNSIDSKKRFTLITIPDSIDYELESDLLRDYNDMLAKDNGDFSSLHVEDQ
jgi:hypothetical protein